MFSEEIKNAIEQTLPNVKFRESGSAIYFEHEDIVGEAKITVHIDYVVLDQIYFKIKNQRKGAGTKLLNAVITACKNNGLNRIECRPTEGGGLAGIEFCKKRGFTPIKNTGKWEKHI